MNHAVRLHVQGHAVWTSFRHMFPCSVVHGMGSGLLFCAVCHNKYVMPILNGTVLCFKMCAHLGTYFKITTILHFFTLQVYNYFYVIFTIICDDDDVI